MTTGAQHTQTNLHLYTKRRTDSPRDCARMGYRFFTCCHLNITLGSWMQGGHQTQSHNETESRSLSRNSYRQ